MGINLTCPECGQQLRFDLNSTTIKCSSCDYTRDTGLDERAAEIRAKGPRPSVKITNQDQVNARAISLFYTAHDYLFQDNQAEAIRCLNSALDIQPDFLDAHLWIAKITDDDQLKREHLSSILAYNGGHLEATQMMLVLNGRLTPEQAAMASAHHEPVIQRVASPVNAATKVLRCPQCQGDLTTDLASGTVKCSFCGYAPSMPERDRNEGDLFIAAMLERKPQPVRWLIGERLLHCNNCGAERTIAATQLSMRCPFCYSNHVIEKDALDSFEQPEGLLPFIISREEAGTRIKEQLRSLPERVKGWFDNNKIAQATLNGFYLPFWVFDATLQVARTRIDNAPSPDRARIAAPYLQSHFSDAVYDVEICAVKSPPMTLTSQLGDYDLKQMVSYQPDLLAAYPAELYTVDFDTAALEARSRISAAMRAKYGARERTDDHQVSINTLTSIQQMRFRLALLPVWVATLVEQDKDVRPALVNGQTGTVVLGKAEKLRS